MAEYLINVFLDEEQQKKARELGLGDQIVEIKGKNGFQVPMTRKDLKKLQKAFPDLEMDESNACKLPADPQNQLLDIIFDMKTVDVMKFAITKLYNPLAGKAPRSKVF